jgi:CBS domain containing-hemolysin-like protein
MEDFRDILFDLILLFIFVFLNAFFVAAEFAIVKVRSTQLQPMAEKNNKRAKASIKVLSRLDEYLSASQLGITIASLGLGWIGEPVTAKLIGPLFKYINVTNPNTVSTISLTLGFVSITFLHIVLGEQAPKYLAIRHSKSTTLNTSIPLTIFYSIFKPAIWALNRSANALLNLIGIKAVPESEKFHSEEELRLLISEGTKTGAIDKTEQQLIEKIFEFNDKTAREIMVPRENMIAIDINESRDKILQRVIDEGYSRIPVYKENIDNIIGVIYSKDLISAAEYKNVIALHDILRNVHFIPETKHIGEILKDFQKKRIHIGIVVNEHGGVEGLITLEDIIEEIVGEIEDEYDIDSAEITRDKKGIYLVNPSISIDDFNKKFNTNIPKNEDDYETLSGFLQQVTGHVPEIYERIDFRGIVFTIMKKSGNKLLQVKIQKLMSI